MQTPWSSCITQMFVHDLVRMLPVMGRKVGRRPLYAWCTDVSRRSFVLVSEDRGMLPGRKLTFAVHARLNPNKRPPRNIHKVSVMP